MSFQAIQRIIQTALVMILLSQMTIIPFSSLYMKYLNLTLPQMGAIRAIQTWSCLLSVPFWVKVASKITNNSFKRIGIIGGTFATMTMCLCLSLVPPKNSPVNVTHCSANNINLTALIYSTQNVNKNSSSSSGVFMSTFQHIKALKGNEKVNLEMKGNSVFDYQDDENHLLLKGKEVIRKQWLNDQNRYEPYTHRQIINDGFNVPENTNVERRNHDKMYSHMSNKIIDFEDIITAQSPIESISKKIKNKFQFDLPVHKHRIQQIMFRNRLDKNQNILKEEMQTVLSTDQESRHTERFYRNTAKPEFYRIHPLLVNKKKRQLSYRKKLLEIIENKHLVNSQEEKEKRRTERTRHNNFREGNYESSSIIPLVSKTAYKTSVSIGNSQTIDSAGQREIKYEKQLFIFFSETFLTVLILTVFCEFFSSQIETWTEVFCEHFFDGESASSLDKIFSNQLHTLKSILRLLSYPLLAVVTAMMPCPYELTYHYLISAIYLIVFLLIVLFFLPLHNFLTSKGFRARKPSKPPANSTNKRSRKTSQTIFSIVACIIMGISTACCSEFILWHGTTLHGFSFNYEYLFCGYFILSDVGCLLLAVCLRHWKNRKGPIDENSDSEEEIIHFAHIGHSNMRQSVSSMPWREDILFLSSSLLLSLLLGLIPLLKSAWIILLLSVLKGFSDALFEATAFANYPQPKVFGYGAGCIVGSILSTMWDINIFLYSAAVITLICSLFWLFFRILLYSRNKSYIHVLLDDNMDFENNNQRIIETEGDEEEEDDDDDDEEDWLVKALQKDGLKQKG